MPVNQFTNQNNQAANEKTDHLPTMQIAVNVCTAQGKRTPAEKTIVYIGAYSSSTGAGIYTFTMDRITGELIQLFDPVQIENPSYLILDQSKHFLYCVMETTKYNCDIAGGGVAAFHINEDGSLKFLNQQPTYGDEPCYLSVDKQNRFLLTANYGSGSMSVFPLNIDGSIKPCLGKVAHSGSGPVKERQSSPHVHFTGFTADEKYLLAVDLGIDQVKFYQINTENNGITPEPNMTIQCKAGSGPRHLVFHKDTAYVINELSSDIGVFSFKNGQFVPKQYISTIPDDVKEPNAPAALKLSKDGGLLFASNRGHDSIAVFKIKNNGLLELSQCLPSGNSGPRDLAIDPQENFLLVANETGNQVNVLAINHKTKLIGATRYSASIHRPSCIQFGTTLME